jgi:hypothetical protein
LAAMRVQKVPHRVVHPMSWGWLMARHMIRDGLWLKQCAVLGLPWIWWIASYVPQIQHWVTHPGRHLAITLSQVWLGGSILMSQGCLVGMPPLWSGWTSRG